MKLRAIILSLALLFLLSALVGGFLYYKAERDAALHESHFSVQSHVHETMEHLESHFLDYRIPVEYLAGLQEIKKALTDGTPEYVQKTNIALDHTHGSMQHCVCYLMDASGTVIATSNRHAPDSFLGKNYQFRPYFQNVMAGKSQYFMAIGVTSKKSGIYISHPVSAEGQQNPVGVVVSKYTLNDVNKELQDEHVEGEMVIVSPEGIVFSENNSEWVNKSLWQLTEIEQEQVRDSKQFGSGPWEWTGLRKIDEHHALSKTGKQYMIHTSEFEILPGWQLVYLHDYLNVGYMIQQKLFRKIGISIALTILFVGFFAFLLFKLADTEIVKRKEVEDDLANTQKNLEKNVEKRTEELRKSNEKLENTVVQVEETAQKLLQSNKMQSALNSMLHLALEDRNLEELLQLFIEQITSLKELSLDNKGAIFIVEEDPELLVMKGSHKLAEPLHEICKTVPFGRCLCGRAALEENVIFVNCIDEKHDNTFDGISEHGHYCVPIFTPDRRICGVFTVYVLHEVKHNQQVEDFLVSAAAILGVIIQHYRSEAEKRESEEKYRAITNTANDAIIMMNEAGEIIYWNPAAERIFGYSAEETVGKDLHGLIAPKQYHDLARKGMEGFVATGHGDAIGETLELSGLKKDGTEFPVELSLSAVFVGGKMAAVGLVRDISERRDAETERSNLQSQLRQAQKMEAIGTLAGGIAHDFNNILTSILGYADLVKDAVQDDQEAMEDLSQVLKAADRARSLVRQILTFSRQTEKELYPVQISLIIKEAMKLLRASIPTTIEIKLNILAKETTVLSDPTQIHQILMNMCTNAFQAMRDGGTLQITLDDQQPGVEFLQSHPDMRDGPFICLQIADTGYGMTPDTLSRVFEPYFSTKKKEDGTGLGLAVVHGIVAGLGGGIMVESTIEVGTTFFIYLPSVTEGAYVEMEEKTPLVVGSEHILYVDDELPIVNLAKRRLERLGYKVSTRTSSVEALEAFRNHPDRYDIVITDQTMPNMNGISLAAEMHKIRPDLPIVLCTGFEEMELGDETSKVGIREILLKPVSGEQFAETTRKILDTLEKST